MLTCLRRRPLRLLAPLLLAVSLAALAWARRAPSGSTLPAAAPRAAARAAAPPYRLEVRGWEGPVSEEGYLQVGVEVRAPYKINAEYPLRLRFAAPPAGLELPLRELGLAEAERDGERRLSFTVPVIARRAGQYVARASLRLSVCTDQQCRRDERAIEIGVLAQ